MAKARENPNTSSEVINFTRFIPWLCSTLKRSFDLFFGKTSEIDVEFLSELWINNRCSFNRKMHLTLRPAVTLIMRSKSQIHYKRQTSRNEKNNLRFRDDVEVIFGAELSLTWDGFL